MKICKKFILTLKLDLSESPDFEWLHKNIDNLIKFLTLFHPLRLFTARNVQENLKNFLKRTRYLKEFF